MEAADAKASSRKDLTEKQPAVEVQSDAVKVIAAHKTWCRPKKKAEAEILGFLGWTFSTPKAADTVRLPRAVNCNRLSLNVSSKRPMTPIVKNEQWKIKFFGFECEPTVFDANDKDPCGVADLGHVVFPADTLAGSSSSSAPFDQMLGYSLALDGGRAVLVNPHEVLDGGRAVLANLHGAAVALAVATSYGGANGAGDVLANLYGAGAFRVVLANLYGAADRGRVVFADSDGAADRVHGGAVNMGHTRAPGCSFALANPDGALDGGRAVFADLYGAANRVHDIAVHRGHARALADEANDACTPSDEANDV